MSLAMTCMKGLLPVTSNLQRILEILQPFCISLSRKDEIIACVVENHHLKDLKAHDMYEGIVTCKLDPGTVATPICPYRIAYRILDGTYTLFRV